MQEKQENVEKEGKMKKGEGKEYERRKRIKKRKEGDEEMK